MSEIVENIKEKLLKRDNIITEVKEKDLEQLQQILKSVFNNNISYEKMQNL